MRQYARFKKDNPGCVLFFRMGDFYEMFDEDAKLTHEVLGLTLTERTSGIPMAGVPYHAAEGYIRRLIEQGYRVAVCEQIQDPSEAKGVVDRAVTRVLTPGTLVDETLLDDGVANIAAAVVPDGDDVMVAWAELSTGMIHVRLMSASGAPDELVRIGPSEIIHPESMDETHPLLARLGELLEATRSRDRIGHLRQRRPLTPSNVNTRSELWKPGPWTTQVVDPPGLRAHLSVSYLIPRPLMAPRWPTCVLQSLFRTTPSCGLMPQR